MLGAPTLAAANDAREEKVARVASAPGDVFASLAQNCLRASERDLVDERLVQALEGPIAPADAAEVGRFERIRWTSSPPRRTRARVRGQAGRASYRWRGPPRGRRSASLPGKSRKPRAALAASEARSAGSPRRSRCACRDRRGSSPLLPAGLSFGVVHETIGAGQKQVVVAMSLPPSSRSGAFGLASRANTKFGFPRVVGMRWPVGTHHLLRVPRRCGGSGPDRSP